MVFQNKNISTFWLSILSSAILISIQPSANAGDKLLLLNGAVDIQSLKNESAQKKLNNVFLSVAPNKNTTQPKNENSSSYFILQFKNAITINDQAELKDAHIEILRYIPEDAYVVHASADSLAAFKNNNLNASDYVPYQAAAHLSKNLEIRSVFAQDKLQFARLHLFKGVDAHAIANQLLNSGYVVSEIYENMVVVKSTLKKISELTNMPGIEWISKRAQMKLFDFEIPKALLNETPDTLVTDAEMRGDYTDLSGYESGTKIMNFAQAWQRGYHGSGQVVGVADTGLDLGDVSQNSRDFAHMRSEYSLGYASTSWADYMGHGTHVAGSVVNAGLGSNQSISGGASEAQLVVQSLWSKQYNTLTVPDNIGDIFSQAYDAGARIHSNSWGNPEAKGEYDSEAMGVDQFVWDHPDMVILFAAGNDGSDDNKDGRVDPGSVSSPSTAKNILSVGASENLVAHGGLQLKLGEIQLAANKFPWPVEPLASDTMSNNPNGIVGFSSRGPTLDGRIKPDVVAPGSNILSNCSHMKDASELWGRYNNDYCFSGGTSMSTPLTAGAVAVVREYLEENKNITSPSAALVKAVMLHTATDLYPGQYGEVGEKQGQELLSRGPNSDQGYGRVDVGQAVTKKLQIVDEKNGLATGESRFYNADSSTRKVTLVYTDAPGAVAAAQTLVNNLDLEVQVGDAVYTSASQVNNTEQVVLDAKAVGNIRITVRGTNVPMGKNQKQPYALVFSAL